MQNYGIYSNWNNTIGNVVSQVDKTELSAIIVCSAPSDHNNCLYLFYSEHYLLAVFIVVSHNFSWFPTSHGIPIFRTITNYFYGLSITWKTHHKAMTDKPIWIFLQNKYAGLSDNVIYLLLLVTIPYKAIKAGMFIHCQPKSTYRYYEMQ